MKQDFLNIDWEMGLDEEVFSLVEKELRLKQLEANCAFLRNDVKEIRMAYSDLLNRRSVKMALKLAEMLRHPGQHTVVNAPVEPVRVFPRINRNNYPLLATYRQLINEIPDGKVGNYYSTPSLTVGIITDDFMFNYYADAVELVYLDPENAEAVINSGQLDLVMYVSCWLGLDYYGDDDLPNCYHYYGDRGFEASLRILHYARKRKIPTVFQTIEDPVSYEYFLPVAQACDFIFTSAQEMVPQYIKDTHNEQVAVLRYGVNPALCNPLGCEAAEQHHLPFLRNSFFFAGSWYDSYAQRCEDMRSIFDGIAASTRAHLYIADRNYYKPNEQIGLYPQVYRPFIIPSFEHRELQKVHKLFDVSINFNTVKDSSTMCAMRVYELQASGVPVLSNPSVAVESAFPNVAIAHNKNEALDFANRFDCDTKQKMRIEGLHNVLTNATVFDRVAQIADAVGLNYSIRLKPIYVVCEAATPDVIRAFEQQSYPKKKLMTLSDNLIAEFENLAGYAVKMTSAFTKSPHYLQDLVNGFKYCDADAIRVAQPNEEAFIVKQERLNVQNGVMVKASQWAELTSEAKVGNCLVVRL